MASYEKINYALRPAKATERRMLCDAMRRLSHFYALSDYQYIGLGSPFFVDFTLVHKALGINKMISIERESVDEARFYFNIPFSCIELKLGESSTVLKDEIDWTKPSIIWLDYDDPITSSMLNDLDLILSNAKSGSMLIISLSAQPGLVTLTPEEINEIEQKSKDAITGERDELLYSKLEKELKDLKKYKNLEEKLINYTIPNEIKSSDLNKNKLPSSYYKIFKSYTKNFLDTINGGKKQEDILKFHQLFNLVYSDNAQMYTYGGLILNDKDAKKYASAKFEDLEFLSTNDNIFKIDIPPLTLKEINFLNSHLPSNIGSDGKLKNSTNTIANHGIPLSSISRYLKIYRYFPTYAEALL